MIIMILNPCKEAWEPYPRTQKMVKINLLTTRFKIQRKREELSVQFKYQIKINGPTIKTELISKKEQVLIK